MEKVDRLGWAAGISVLSYGRRIGIRVTHRAALERLPEVLPPGWRTASSPVVERLYSLVVGGPGERPGPRRFYVAYADAARIARTAGPEDAYRILEDDLQLFVARAARRRVFVHAGVVGWRGQAILIPGPSFSGKSRLVGALVRAGATYYSDEYAVLDRRGLVHPYPVPLSLRGDDGGLGVRRRVEERGDGILRPLPVGLIAVTRYRPGASWRPRLLSPGRGALAVLANTVPARDKPAEVLVAVRLAVSGTSVLKGTRGEAEDAAYSLLERLEAQSGRMPRRLG